jgi:endonuclease YncB( thermonuclease family)
VSKPWTSGKATVALPAEPRPSRIRRDPPPAPTVVKPRPSRQREMALAAAGVALIAAACAGLIVGISEVTSVQSPAAAAASRSAERFRYCRSGGGPDCVVDGDTLKIGGERFQLAGMDAPEVAGRCREESRRGVQAAVRLHELLNGGTVAVANAERGADGTVARRVEVDGRDVALTMIAGGLARQPADGPQDWC